MEELTKLLIEPIGTYSLISEGHQLKGDVGNVEDQDRVDADRGFDAVLALSISCRSTNAEDQHGADAGMN